MAEPPSEPIIQFVAYPHVSSAVCKALRAAEQSIVGTAYCFDSSDGTRILGEKRRNANVSIRVLLDSSQYESPSCRCQPEVISLMMEWGVQFRTYRPDRGRFAIMHAKTWAVDGSVALLGSANFTNNGMENSEEVLAVIRNDGYISDYLAWFERLWNVATVVTKGAPEKFLEARAARNAAGTMR